MIIPAADPSLAFNTPNIAASNSITDLRLSAGNDQNHHLRKSEIHAPQSHTVWPLGFIGKYFVCQEIYYV